MKQARRAGEGVHRVDMAQMKRGAPADGIVQLKGDALTPQAVSLSEPGTWAGAPPPRCNQYTMSTEQRRLEWSPAVLLIPRRRPTVTALKVKLLTLPEARARRLIT